jgi:RNA polymerase sigma-70 factor (ECF subfamily)
MILQRMTSDHAESDHAENDHELMRRCRDGDAAAFERLVVRWRAPLLRILGRLVNQPGAAQAAITTGGADVDDLSQEVFLRVLRHRDRYRERGAFSTWLYRIALNVTRDAARRRTRRQALVRLLGRTKQDTEPAEPAGPPRDAERDELRRHVAAALDALPRKLREPLVLRHFGNLTIAEVAEVTGVAPSTARCRIETALTRLRSELLRRGVSEEDISP